MFSLEVSSSMQYYAVIISSFTIPRFGLIRTYGILSFASHTIVVLLDKFVHHNTERDCEHEFSSIVPKIHYIISSPTVNRSA